MLPSNHWIVIAKWKSQKIIVVDNTTLHFARILLTRPKLRRPMRSAHIKGVVVDTAVDKVADAKVNTISGATIRRMGVCVCFRPPVRTVCPNHEVVELQHQAVTIPDLFSDYNAYTIYNPPAPPVSTVLWIFFPPPPKRIFYPPPHHISPVDTASLYLCILLSPPPLERSQINRPPGRRPRLPAATACLRFPPMSE